MSENICAAEIALTDVIMYLSLLHALYCAGNPLPLTQEEVLKRVRGCAIEARIYAENPMREFLPATGRLVHMHTPDKDGFESGVRADYGIRSGDAISTFYDPMIAKLIAYDDTREGAVSKLERALRGFQVSQRLPHFLFEKWRI